MNKYKVINKTKKTIVIEEAIMANTFFSRLKGLLGKASIETEKGIIIKPCKSVHTFFMAFSIDVVFVDKNNCVLHVIESMRPYKISSFHSKAEYVIELSCGGLLKSGTIEGDFLEIELIG